MFSTFAQYTRHYSGDPDDFSTPEKFYPVSVLTVSVSLSVDATRHTRHATRDTQHATRNTRHYIVDIFSTPEEFSLISLLDPSTAPSAVIMTASASVTLCDLKVYP